LNLGPDERVVALVIRRLGPCDLAAAANLHAVCFEDAWSEASIAQLLGMPGSTGLVGFLKDEPVALLIANWHADEAEILTICVTPDKRRRGFARLLLTTLTESMDMVGVRRLCLEVAEDNLAGRALYQGLGFGEVLRRGDYYRRANGAAVAALVLARSLPAPVPDEAPDWSSVRDTTGSGA
jgi:ribosomal-protein-alanine N-acetyltransferase